MAKTVGLKIEIEGLSTITKEVVKLEQELKASKTAAKDLEKEIEGLNKQISESDNAEAVESGRNRGRGRVKLPDAWTRVLKIDDRLKLPLKSYWVESDVVY